ncbi:MAG: OmpA family protein [Hyphomicrobiales bacterium]
MAGSKFFGLFALILISASLTGCSSGGNNFFGSSNQNTETAAAPPPPTGTTNTPVGGGLNITPGSEEDFQVNVGRRTFFKENSTALDMTAKETLDKQVTWLNQHPSVVVKIQGFADDPGSEPQNVALSQKRADAVRNYLVSKGVSASRVTAKGYGTQRKVRDCADLACKSQNRRAITNPQNAAAS